MTSHKTVYREVFERCSLIVFRSQCISPERDAGETARDGVKTKKVTIQTFDPVILKPIKLERQRCVRACATIGTKMESLNAWLVPNERVFELLDVFNKAAENVVGHASKIAGDIQNLVEEHAIKNPEYADLIRQFAPSSEEVMNGIRFMSSAWHLNPDDVIADAAIQDDVSQVPMQALMDFKNLLRDAGVDAQRPQYTPAIANVLQRVQAKASGLAFVCPVLENIAKGLQDLLATLPARQKIEGASAIAVGSVITQLLEPYRLFASGGFVTAVSSQSAQPAPVSTVGSVAALDW